MNSAIAAAAASVGGTSAIVGGKLNLKRAQVGRQSDLGGHSSANILSPPTMVTVGPAPSVAHSANALLSELYQNNVRSNAGESGRRILYDSLDRALNNVSFLLLYLTFLARFFSRLSRFLPKRVRICSKAFWLS
jgi:hypothetical protein